MKNFCFIFIHLGVPNFTRFCNSIRHIPISALLIFLSSIVSISCSKDKTNPIKSNHSYSSSNNDLNGNKANLDKNTGSMAALENEKQEIKALRKSLEDLKLSLGQSSENQALEEVEMVSIVDSASELNQDSMIESAQSDIVESLIASSTDEQNPDTEKNSDAEATTEEETEDTPPESEEEKKSKALMYIGLAMTVSMGIYSGYKGTMAFKRQAYVGAAIGAGLMTSMFVIGALWAMDQDEEIRQQMLATAIIVYGGLLVAKGMIMYTSTSIASKFVDSDIVEPVRKILGQFNEPIMKALKADYFKNLGPSIAAAIDSNPKAKLLSQSVTQTVTNISQKKMDSFLNILPQKTADDLRQKLDQKWGADWKQKSMGDLVPDFKKHFNPDTFLRYAGAAVTSVRSFSKSKKSFLAASFVKAGAIWSTTKSSKLAVESVANFQNPLKSKLSDNISTQKKKSGGFILVGLASVALGSYMAMNLTDSDPSENPLYQIGWQTIQLRKQMGLPVPPGFELWHLRPIKTLFQN